MMFQQRSMNRAIRSTTRAARLAGCADATGPVALEQFEPRLVLAINPTADEQFMMELLNRFRTDPQGELAKLTSSLSGEARSSDPDVNSALDFFNVSGPVLQSQWSSLTAVPALAWNEALYQMAELQSQNMILDDMQEHNLPGRPGLAARAGTFGYNYTILGENIFAYAESVFHGHAAFAIDWGSGANGIQNPPGHRQSMLSSQFREVGIRIIPETAQSTEVGPLVMTQDFGTRQSFGDSWLVGVVYDDANTNDFYTVGEGLGGVTVTADGGSGQFITTTFSAGGYQIQLPAGTYSVTFSGGEFGSPLTIQDVVIGSTNAKVDAIAGQVAPAPVIKVLGNGAAIGAGDSTPDPADHTSFGTADIAATQIVRTFTIRNEGNLALNISGLPRVVISSDDAGVFSLTTDLALASIDPSQELTFQITFDPAIVGTYGAVITILSDDATTPEFRFNIEGTAVSDPNVAMFGRQTVAILDGSTEVSAEDGTWFGKHNVVGESSTRRFVIRNDGSSPLDLLSDVLIRGVHSLAFQVIAQPDDTSLAPGESTTFQVRFNPGAAGLRFARVVFRSNDPDTQTFNFAIRGQGVVTPLISIRGNTRLIESGDDTPRTQDETDFGRANVDGGRKRGDFMIRNDGLGWLRLTTPIRVNITGNNASDFRLLISPPEYVGPGRRTSFSIRFNPTAEGQRSAWVVIRTNDPETPRYTFRITGEGFVPV